MPPIASTVPFRSGLGTLRLAALRLGMAVALGVALTACGSEVTPASEGTGGLPVEMHIRWVLDSEFPATMSVHEPPDDQDVYEIRLYEAGEDPVVGREIPEGILRARYGEPARFIALLRNESDEAVRFWVAPHLPMPHVSEQGLTMFCLCTGQTYEVPAGGSWTRVMEFGVTRRANLEGPIALTHVVVRGDMSAPTPVPLSHEASHQ